MYIIYTKETVNNWKNKYKRKTVDSFTISAIFKTEHNLE